MAEFVVLVKGRNAKRFNKGIPVKKGTPLKKLRREVLTLPRRNKYKIITRTQFKKLLRGRIKKISRRKK